MRLQENLIVMNKRMADQLLCCMQDDVGEIRLIAADILINYAPECLHEYCLDRMSAFSSLLLSSVKQQKAELGALFCSCIVHFHLKNKNTTAALELLNNILKQLDDSSRDLQCNLLKTARQNSPFGKLRALSLMISETRKIKDFYKSTASCKIVEAISEIALKFIKFFLDSLFSCKNSNDYVASADFEEITTRINKLVLDDQNSENNQTLLTDDHEVVLACGWLSLRDGAALYAEAESLLSEITRRSDDHVRRVCKNFYHVLCFCRHRGAIESTYDSMVRYLCALPVSCFTAPLQLLDEAIATLESTKVGSKPVAGATITRRSAGNPLLIKAVLTADVKKHNSMKETHDYVDRLTRVATSDQDESCADETADLPQVDALYAIKSLLFDSFLGPKLDAAHVLESALTTSLWCLKSDVWVVRNAATHLLGAVSARMLGQKHTEDGVGGGSFLTAGEFFTRFPLALTLAQSVLSGEEDDPRVFPLLSILCRLKRSAGIYTGVEKGNELGFVKEKMLGLLTSKSYSIRVIASKCCLSLNSAEKCLNICSYFFSVVHDNGLFFSLKKYYNLELIFIKS